jgi:hypothetical protein
VTATSSHRQFTLSTEGEGFVKEVGFHRLIDKNDAKEGFAFYLNEAVTEHLAQIVFDEFLRRTGTENELRIGETISLSDHLHLRKSFYAEARTQIFAFIQFAAEELRVTEASIWQGFTRQYFSGEISFEDFSLAMQSVSGLPFDYVLSAEDQMKLNWESRRKVWLHFLHDTLFRSLDLSGIDGDFDSVEFTQRIRARFALKLSESAV